MNIRKKKINLTLIFVHESPSLKIRLLKFEKRSPIESHPGLVIVCMLSSLQTLLGESHRKEISWQPSTATLQPQGKEASVSSGGHGGGWQHPLQKPRMIWREWNQFVMNEEFQRQNFLQRIKFYIILLVLIILLHFYSSLQALYNCIRCFSSVGRFCPSPSLPPSILCTTQ